MNDSNGTMKMINDSLNLTSIDWITSPYLMQELWDRLSEPFLIAFFVLYLCYFQFFFRGINSTLLQLQSSGPIFRFLYILVWLNFVNTISSWALLAINLPSKCPGVFKKVEIVVLLVSSITSDCTFRSAIWITIVISFLGSYRRLTKELIHKATKIIITSFLIWSTFIRTAEIRYSQVVADFGDLCDENCCSSGYIIYNSSIVLFEIIKYINQYINFLSVILMLALINIQIGLLKSALQKPDRTGINETQLLLIFNVMFLLLNSFYSIDPIAADIFPEFIRKQIHTLATWTPLLTIICHSLQMVAMIVILPDFREVAKKLFKKKFSKRRYGFCV
uniref:Serpentine receptor class gamma n=1 Tax=Caenorhabditis tropicalis TaxID=1561998 RepID=A0A1I7V248_9PELO